jgi:hypothetical protein
MHQKVLTEMVNLTLVDDDTWKIVQGVQDPGVTVKPSTGRMSYTTSLRSVPLVVASLIQVNDKFEKDLIEDGKSPTNDVARPIDMVHAIKAGSHTSDAGVKFIIDDALRSKIVTALVPRATGVIDGSDFDFFVTVDSKSDLADMFAHGLGAAMKKKVVKKGAVKGRAQLDFQNFPLDDKTKKTLSRSFERSFEGGKFKMKKFPGKFRHLVKLNVDMSDELQDIASTPTAKAHSAWLVDDIITSGTTLDQAAKSLSEQGINVIGVLTMFKMKDK